MLWTWKNKTSYSDVLLLQEHQNTLLGNTMQSAVAVLNNLVSCRNTNMTLLYEHGMYCSHLLLCAPTACKCFKTGFFTNGSNAVATRVP